MSCGEALTSSCLLMHILTSVQVPGAQATGKTTAAEAGASKLAQALCDPPPLKPNGKQQKGGTPRVCHHCNTCAQLPAASRDLYSQQYMPGHKSAYLYIYTPGADRVQCSVSCIVTGMQSFSCPHAACSCLPQPRCSLQQQHRSRASPSHQQLQQALHSGSTSARLARMTKQEPPDQRVSTWH
jgi:hypothetical protein